MIELKDIINARKEISGKIKRTPLLPFEIDGEISSFKIYLKAENFQKSGSFKIRGILNKLAHLNLNQKKNGFVAASAGNHAISLAFVASLGGFPCVAVMPKATRKSKIKKAKILGAKIVLKKDDLWAECLKIARKRKLTAIHPFDDPLIIAGQGTIGLEVLEDLPEISHIFVPIGGGGLISGVATALKLKKPGIKVIGVEPRGAATMFQSIRKNGIIHLKERETVADGLSAAKVGENTFEITKKYVDEIVLVSDKEIISAMKILFDQCKILVEPAGATALAAILFRKTRIPSKSKVVCILSGGNISRRELCDLLKK